MIECDKTSNGCHGGLATKAFTYAVANGVQADSSYPYWGSWMNSKCMYNKDKVVFKPTGQGQVTYRNTDQLKARLLVQPVAVSIESNIDLQFYFWGIYNNAGCGNKYNHAVFLVGFGEEKSGKKYWYVKNSWGRIWGTLGYVKFARKDGSEMNVCGITDKPVYPTFDQ